MMAFLETDGLRNFMVKYGIKGHEADEIIILSNYGQTSVDPKPPMPIWTLKKRLRTRMGRYVFRELSYFPD